MGKSRASGGTTVKTERGLDAKLKRIAADLSENVRLIGALTTPALPVTGFVILRDAEAVSSAVVKLARNNPAVLRALQKASQVGPGVAVGRFMLTVGVAIAVDTQRMMPDTQLSMLLGVAAIHAEMSGEGGRAQVYTVPPPTARYVD